MANKSDQKFEAFRRAASVFIAFLGIVGVVFLLIALWINRFDPVLTNLVLANFPVIIGLPFASVAAFVIVALFRQQESPLELEGLGFKFKGAAGEIVLWNISFIVTAQVADGRAAG